MGLTAPKGPLHTQQTIWKPHLPSLLQHNLVHHTADMMFLATRLTGCTPFMAVNELQQHRSTPLLQDEFVYPHTLLLSPRNKATGRRAGSPLRDSETTAAADS